MARGRPWRARVVVPREVGAHLSAGASTLSLLVQRFTEAARAARSTCTQHAQHSTQHTRSTHAAHSTRRSTKRARDCKRLIRDERTRLRASARDEFVLGTAAYNECVWRCSSTTEPRRRHHLRRCGSLVAAPDRATLPHDPYCTRLMDDARAPPLLHFCQGGLLSRTDDALRKVQRAAPRQSRPSHGLGETGGG